MTSVNHTECKERARAVMNACSPTIFIAALIGVGIPILIGWLNGGGDGLFKITIENVQDLDIHDLRHLFDSAWGQLTAAVDGVVLGLYAIWALVFGLAVGAVKAILKYGFIDYTLRAERGVLGQPQDTLVGFRIPVRVIVAHILRQFIIWLGMLCFVVPGIIAAYSLRMTERVMIDHPELSVVQCMRYSRELMRGHRLDLFGMDLSFIGWGILEGLTKELSGIYSRTYQTLAENFFYEGLYAAL